MEMDMEKNEKRTTGGRFKAAAGLLGVLALLGSPYLIEGLSSDAPVAVEMGVNPDGMSNADINALPENEWLDALKSKGYVLATATDFEKIEDAFAPKGSYYAYSGKDPFVILPKELNGEPLTDTYMMFHDAASAGIKGVASRHTTLTNMKMMFYKSQATELDLTHLNTTGVTDMAGMFNRAEATKLNLRGFDTSQVTNMAFLFGSTAAETIDLSTFDTSQVTEMSYLFRGAKAKTLDLSHFETGKVTDMKYMFFEAHVTDLDISGFDLATVTNTERMFTDAPLAGTLLARSETDAEKLNATMDKPVGLTFEAKTPD